jgi:hypothetical protein
VQESLIHYLWQFQYFDKRDLRTASGEEVHVFNPGNKNSHAGPDFFNARIKIGDIEWVGSVEIHVNASDWLEHKHETDAAYENVVLHVVWKNDKPIKRNDQTLLPTIELKNKVDEHLLLKYKKLLNSPEAIPCAAVFNKVNDLVKISMLDSTLTQRLDAKAQNVLDLLQRNNNDWDETCFQMLSKNFGFKVNTEPFLQLAQALPYKSILKQGSSLTQIEAMLFGQAGFLEKNLSEEYYQLLKREYQLLKHKYNLSDKILSEAQWRFLRLRPANFPTIRLSQLAALLFTQKNIFSKLIQAENIKSLKEIFLVEQSPYWRSHYLFQKKSKEEIAAIGEVSVENIIINTVVPMLAAYSSTKDDQAYMDRAIDLLQHISPEENTITRQWIANGLKCKSAFDSQALIELHNNFCLRRRCLECSIGSSLIKSQAK